MSLNFRDKLSSGVQRLIGVRNLQISDKKPAIRSLETSDSGETKIYHFVIENPDEKSRVHLRIDPDGHGTLIVNANRVMHFNPTAALMAFLVLSGKNKQEVITELSKKYKVSNKQLASDYETFTYQLENLVRPDGACPIHDLEVETVAPFSARPTAPYRMDLAVTYRCNNDCSHCYNLEHPTLTPSPSPKGRGELKTDEWKKVLDKTWELGIPHVVFTGGEPTLREDLPELIAHAEANGQITGMNTNARRLSDPKFVEKLVSAGLDHVQITVESSDADIHNEMVRARAFDQTIAGLKNVLATRLYVMTNTTMLQTNVHTIPATLDFLAELGVPTIGLNALIYSGHGAQVGTGLPEADLHAILEMARHKTEMRGQRLIWYTPTEYCGFDPMSLDLGVKGCTAALYNMCVEPDGAVLPCQSYYSSLGNILSDDWNAIWNHDLAVRLRERKGLPEKCGGCALLSECGGGCPLKFETFERSNVLEAR